MRRRRRANGYSARTTKRSCGKTRRTRPGGEIDKGRPYGRNRKRRSLCRAQRIPPETARHERERFLRRRRKSSTRWKTAKRKRAVKESIGNHLSQIDTARLAHEAGRGEDGRKERTQALADKLKEVESQIKELTDAPAKSRSRPTSSRQSTASIRRWWLSGQLQDKTVTVTVKTVQEGQQAPPAVADRTAPPGFAEAATPDRRAASFIHTSRLSGLTWWRSRARAPCSKRSTVAGVSAGIGGNGQCSCGSPGIVRQSQRVQLSRHGSFEATMAPDQQAALEVAFRRVAPQKGARR